MSEHPKIPAYTNRDERKQEQGLADKRQLPPEKAATTDEVLGAIRKLTTAQLQSLGRFAHYRLEAVRRASVVNTGEDLVQEAIARTITGKRNWNMQAVDFLGHLIGVIKSMTSHLGEKDADPWLAADVTKDDDDGKPSGPVANAPSRTPSAHRVLYAKERINGLEEYFKDDPLILNIIGGFRDRMPVKEIADILEVSEDTVESAIRKIRRHQKNITTEGRTHA
jgi:DNA-directed RNA polymerase specialized sigma24 family protein